MKMPSIDPKIKVEALFKRNKLAYPAKLKPIKRLTPLQAKIKAVGRG